MTPVGDPPLPVVEIDWTGCEAGGIVIGGEATLRWTSIDPDFGAPLTMEVTGALTLGGGVPMVTLSRLVWSADAPPGVAGTLRLSGELTASGVTRTFTFDVIVDD